MGVSASTWTSQNLWTFSALQISLLGSHMQMNSNSTNHHCLTMYFESLSRDNLDVPVFSYTQVPLNQVPACTPTGVGQGGGVCGINMASHVPSFSRSLRRGSMLRKQVMECCNILSVDVKPLLSLVFNYRTALVCWEERKEKAWGKSGLELGCTGRDVCPRQQEAGKTAGQPELLPRDPEINAKDAGSMIKLGKWGRLRE